MTGDAAAGPVAVLSHRTGELVSMERPAHLRCTRG
jgi:hypothetical protein